MRIPTGLTSSDSDETEDNATDGTGNSFLYVFHIVHSYIQISRKLTIKDINKKVRKRKKNMHFITTFVTSVLLTGVIVVPYAVQAMATGCIKLVGIPQAKPLNGFSPK